MILNDAMSDITIPKEMKIALVASLLFHVFIVTLGMVGLPFVTRPPLLPSQPIAVEILDLSEETTANKPPSQMKLQPKTNTEPLKAPPKVVTPPKVDTKAPPKIKPLDKPPEIKETNKPEPKTPPPPSEKLEKPKPPEPKQEEPKEEAAETQEDLFQSVLKNLQDAPDTPVDETVEKTDQATEAELSPLAKFSQKLSASDVVAIQQTLDRQFSECRGLMPGARDAHKIMVTLRIRMNPNRTVQSVTVVDQIRYSTDTFYRAAADAALRAVRHPACEVLDLPPDKYDLWKDMIFKFKPTE